MGNSDITQDYMQVIQLAYLEVIVLEGQISKLGLAASAISIVGFLVYLLRNGRRYARNLRGFVGPTLILFSQEIEKLV